MSAGRLILVGWDAADWQFIHPLLDAGEMPALARLVEGGVIGDLATLEPILSPLLWTSIVTGKRAHEHGVLGFAEPAPESESGVRPISSNARRAKALWNMLDEHGLSSQVVGFFASHPAEPVGGQIVSNLFPHPTGALATDWPVPSGCLSPASLEADLAPLRVHPSEISADTLLTFIPELARIDDSDAGERVERFRRTLAQAATQQAVHTWLLAHHAADFSAVYFDLIDRCSHDFMCFHPPRMQHVTEEHFEIFRDVMRGVYRFQDLMLARTLELAGEDATVVVVSDHGFHSGRLRPGPRGRAFLDGVASEHRLYGIFCAKGPGIRRDERLSGATLLDVTPSLLHHLGLPVGNDMPGRVLEDIWERPSPVRRIPSWEQSGVSNVPPDATAPNPWEDLEGLRQLVELGYLPPLEDDKEKNLELCRFEMRKNLARDYLHSGRPADAAPIFAELAAKRPNGNQLATFHARALFEAGRFDDCRSAIEALEERIGHSPSALLLRGTLASADGRPEEALQSLLMAEHAAPDLQGLHRRIGTVYLELGRWTDARRAFLRAIELDPDHARAHYGLAVADGRQGRNEQAVRSARRAVALRRHFPLAHFQLGLAAGRIGDIDLARRALETCLEQRPAFAAAHLALADVLEQAFGEDEGARQLRARASELEEAAATSSRSTARA